MPAIAICMATYEPDPERLEAQLSSIVAQDRSDWVCLISDDGSSPEARGALERLTAGDPRFQVQLNSERVGFYRNFERALAMVADGPERIAFADQDDRWYPDKLSRLASALENPSVVLSFSDFRLVDETGEVLSDTWFVDRGSGHDDIVSMLVTNIVTGAASMFRRELLERALPFPEANPELAYHDHWLALCGLAAGELAFVPEPTYDRIRHREAVTVLAQGPAGGLRPRTRRENRRLRLALAGRRIRERRWRPGWRALYERRYRHLCELAEAVLGRHEGVIRPDRKAALERFLRAERSAPAAIWLGLRGLRPLVGRTETLGRERLLFRAVLWPRLAPLARRLEALRPGSRAR